jgi:hypothetical protein
VRRALFIAAGLTVLAPASAAEARTLSDARARSAALSLAAAEARQEPSGGGARVESCSRRSSLRVRCRVSFRYTEPLAYRGRYDVVTNEYEWISEERACSATAVVQYPHRRSKKLSSALEKRRCSPFFDNPPGR